MTPYYQEGGITILHSDNLAAMAELADCSFDAIVTDPPAGIGFMGKEWDDFRRLRNAADAGRDSVFGRTSRHGPEYGRRERTAFVGFLTSVFTEAYRLLKPGAHALVWAIPRTSHWTATALEDAGFEIRDVVTHIQGQGFPKSLDVSKAIDRAAGAEREVVGTKYSSCRAARGGLEFVGGESIDALKHRPVTSAATPAARQWEGWGTALKPASEHWILARKPLSEPTVAKNVLRWGTGAVNVDGCRVEGKWTTWRRKDGSINPNGGFGDKYVNGTVRRENVRNLEHPAGRWPANLVLDEFAAALLDEQSGERKSGARHPAGHRKFGGNCFNNGATLDLTWCEASTGGASRFFYCSKASRADRGEGNDHPTVKSTALMRWLCRLITPPGGQVLDMFGGSGTTTLACQQEGFGCTLIEQDEHNCEIAAKRLQQQVLPMEAVV